MPLLPCLSATGALVGGTRGARPWAGGGSVPPEPGPPRVQTAGAGYFLAGAFSAGAFFAAAALLMVMWDAVIVPLASV